MSGYGGWLDTRLGDMRAEWVLNGIQLGGLLNR